MSIPHSLTARDQWVWWREIRRDDSSDKRKLPLQLDGWPAKPNDPDTWTSYSKIALRHSVAADHGIAYVLSAADPFCGVDLDACRDPVTGRVAEWAREIVLRFATYAELSPSRTGIKLFGIGKSPLDTGKNKKLDGEPIAGKHPGIEIYDHARVFTVTGLKLAGMPDEPVECQAAIDELCRRYWPPATPRPVLPPLATAQYGVADKFERARRYVAKMPPAVSGSRGHNTAFHVACILVIGFALTPDQAYPIFEEYSRRCEPPWSDREIQHKLCDADKLTVARGYLLGRPADAHSGTHRRSLPLAPPRWCYGHRAHTAALAVPR